MTLKELTIGQKGIITKVGGEGVLRQHFLDMGVIPGAEIELIKFAPMGDPMELRVHGYELTLRLDDAAKIDIEPVKSIKKTSEGEVAEDKNSEVRNKRKHIEHPGLGEGGKYHDRKTETPLDENEILTFALVGNHFDIHGGGADLTFPHHENEIAQSEASTGEQYVNYWMHVGFINVDGEKMSKSLGNFFTIRDVMEKFHPEVIRYFIVSSHYRSPVNFSDVALKEAKAALSRFYHSCKAYQAVYGETRVEQKDEALVERFNAAMRDDFNTAEAIAVLFEVNKELNRAVKEQQAEQAAIYYATLRHLTDILGLVQHNVEDFLKSDIGQEALGLSEEQISDLIQQRVDAKKAKDFARADEIRQSLLAQGVVLEDTRQGTVWRRAD